MSELSNQRFLYVPIPALLFSAVLHAAIATLLIGLHVTGFMAFQTLKARKSPYQDFIQVDVVALPDELPHQRSAVDMSKQVSGLPKAITEIKPPVEPDLMVIPKDNATGVASKEMARKNQLERDKALKQLESEAKREQALKQLAEKRGGATGRVQLKGNILAKGNARTGEIGTPKDLYDTLVRDAIKQHFNVYSWQKKRDLVSVVIIDLFPSGRVRKKRLLSSSGDRLYDAAVLQAIDRAQPLPMPDDLSLIAGGIRVEFKPME